MTRHPATLQDLRALMPKLAFNSHLGLRVVRKHADGVTIDCRLRPEFLNMHGTLHGGVTATLVDVAGGFGALSLYGMRPAATVEMKVNYFLPVTGTRAVARSRALRTGNTLAVFQVEVRDDRKRLAAAALITYMLVDTAKTG